MNGYAISLAAAGATVLSYHEDGSYQGRWFAYTTEGFYSGYYGSCSGCDWREGEYSNAEGWPESDSEIGRKIDAGIGREILKKPAMTKAELVKELTEMSCDDEAEVRKWIEKCAP